MTEHMSNIIKAAGDVIKILDSHQTGALIFVLILLVGVIALNSHKRP